MRKNYFVIFTFSLLLIFPMSVLKSQTEKLSPTKIIKPVHFDISENLRDVEPIPPGIRDRSWKDNVIKNKDNFQVAFSRPSTHIGPDPALQDQIHVSRADATVGQNFEGASNLSGVAPPDTDGDVGPNHYFQMVNSVYAIYDKNGNLLEGPADNITLWSGFDGPWSSTNDGDPIVLYDEYADVWIISQFSLPNYPNGPFYELVAVSATPDPTGAWHRYAYEFDNMPDYPKFGVWPDGYYFAINQFAPPSLSFAGGGICALNRDKMIAGDPDAEMIFFSLSTQYGSLLPADLDGPTLPPSGTPNYFVSLEPSALYMWEVDINWSNPNSSTANLADNFSVQSYSYSGININQPGTSQLLDELASRLMYRLQYRNFGTHQSMVTNHTVNVGGGRAGVRWYELRNTGGGWDIYQTGTYAPADGNHRWMGSVAMNGNGDIAVGYSVSGSSTYPSIRVAGQTAGAPEGLGVLDVPETSIKEGSNSQTGVDRWGDYSMMSVDPVDDNAFWYTTEFTSGGWNWKTQIASFSFSEPVPQAPVANFSATPTYVAPGGSVNYQDQSQFNPTSWDWSFPGGTPSTSTQQNPTVVYNSVGSYSATLTVSNAQGSDSKTITNYIVVEETPITYCTSQGNNSSYEWISNVQFGAFSNSSGAAGYTDFTGQNVSIDAGSNISLSLSPGFSSSTYTEYWKVWIDYNKNGDFTDSGEEVYSGVSTGTVSGNFNVPVSATGTTRMRVSMKWNAVQTPCETFSYGEVEDYTVTFESSAPVAPVTEFSASANTVAVGSVVNFTDLSTNIPTSWSWLFTGGNPASSTAQNPSTQYNATGTYTVELTATNAGGSDTETKTNYITVLPLPVAEFSANVTTINEGETVNFTDLSSNTTGWSWSFAGGTPSSSNSQNPSVTYNNAGNYTVELTASNAVGSDTETKTAFITVNEVIVTPVADFMADATSVSEGAQVSFTDLSTNEPTSWSWTFDGGSPSSSTAQNPTVVYNNEGTYNVTLVAGNSAGSDSEIKTGYITVSSAPSLVTLSFSDFEGGWGIWTDGGGDCRRYTKGNYAYGGNAALDIQDNSGVASSFYMTNGEDVQTPGYVQVDIDFYFIAISMDNSNEDFWVQYYDGSTWQTVADFNKGVEFENNIFYHATVTVLESAYNFPGDMKVRFMCDASGNRDDVYIDDITITASTSVTSGPIRLLSINETDHKFNGIGEEEFAVYPNPAYETLHIVSGEEEELEVMIYNTSGQQVQHTVIPVGYGEIDISKLEQGMYIIKIIADDEVFSKKIIKK